MDDQVPVICIAPIKKEEELNQGNVYKGLLLSSEYVWKFRIRKVINCRRDMQVVGCRVTVEYKYNHNYVHDMVY